MNGKKIKTVLVDSGFPEALSGGTEARFVYNLLPYPLCGSLLKTAILQK